MNAAQDRRTWAVPKVLLAVGLGLLVLGFALIPLPGPGYPVAFGGAILLVVATVLHLTERRHRG